MSGGLVYVANAAATAPNYTGFTLNAGGHLRAIAGSTVTLPDASQPGDVLFNGDGTKLVGTRVGTSLIDSFTVGANGLLTAAAGSPFAAQGLGPFGSEFRPTNPTQLFVSNAHGGPGQRQRLGVRRRRRRDAELDRRFAVRQQPDGAVLGRDHPRRPVPVRRQHRGLDHLELLDRGRWQPDAARQHAGQRLPAAWARSTLA